jgi:hypothetical protein
MMNDLAPKLDGQKAKDLLSRLADKRANQALPAEMELALLWAINSLGEFDIEPEWWGDSRRPDAFTDFLVPGKSAVIDVVAINDNSISGETEMAHVARVFSERANQIRKGFGTFLYYTFGEESGHDGNKYFRRRLASKTYVLTPYAEEMLRGWIMSGVADSKKLVILEDGLHVSIEKQSFQQILFHNFHSSMPPESYSIDDNPLFEALKRKLAQLAAAPPGALRYIFLADVGSTLLNRLGTFSERNMSSRPVTGTKILRHFISEYRDKVDSVVIFSPRCHRQVLHSDRLYWEIAIVNRPGYDIHPDSIDMLKDSNCSRGWQKVVALLGGNVSQSFDDSTVALPADRG